MVGHIDRMFRVSLNRDRGQISMTPRRETTVATSVDHEATRMALHHLGDAARMHAAYLSEGFFPRLGERFLRTYYRGFVLSPHAVALVTHVDGRPAGMLVGTTRHAAHHRWLLRSLGVRLAFSALLSLAFRPRLAASFLHTRAGRYAKAVRRLLFRRVGSPSTGDGEPASDVAVLSHVAVDERYRGRGLASALNDAFVDAVQRAGTRDVQVATRATEGAGGFYIRNGWRRLDSHVNHDGVRMEIYGLRLD